jgi:hypothetical protein
MCCCSTTWLAINYRVHCHSDIEDRLEGVISSEETHAFRRNIEQSRPMASKPNSNNPKEQVQMKDLRKKVLEAVYPLHWSKRIVTTDNYYSSTQLLEALKLYGLYGRGTIRPDSKHAPKCFMFPKSKAEREKFDRGASRQGVCRQFGIVAASWVDNAIVNIVSNADDSDKVTIERRIGRDTLTIQAPRCIDEYTKNMGGVDHFDQILERFAISKGHSFQKWHKKLGMGFIDMARSNAYICRKMSGVVESRDEHRQFMIDLIGELLNGEWMIAVGDTGLLYNDSVIPPSPMATPTKQTRPVTPTRTVPECDARSSRQLFESRAKRQCVICRFEGRKLAITTVHCKSHNVSLCMRSYELHDDVPSDRTHTCWQKFHDFYLSRGLFNRNGNIRRACSLYKTRKLATPDVEEGSFVRLLLDAADPSSGERRPNEDENERESEHADDIDETENEYEEHGNYVASDEDIEEPETPETPFVQIMSIDSNQSWHPSEDFDSGPLRHNPLGSNPTIGEVEESKENEEEESTVEEVLT